MAIHQTHPIQAIDFTKKNHAFVIEASAGTGKTWTIERLFVKAILSNPEYKISNFLVVTFTNDATTELNNRILEFLKSTLNSLIQLKNSPTTKVEDIFIAEILAIHPDIDKHTNAINSSIQNFDQASIYTLHSFCKRILTQYQFNTQISPNFKLREYKKDLLSQLIRKFFIEEIFNNNQLNKKIAQIYSNLNQLLIDRNRTTDYIEILATLLKKNNLITYHNRQFKLNYQIINHPNLELLTQDLSNHPSKTNKSLAHLNLLCTIAQYISKYLNNYFGKKNLLDFDDIILILSDELQLNSNLANNLYNEYPIAFIDEFQDTDIHQWNILNTLYKLDTPEKRGIVIAVGDPKQAIYKFRGADINTYINAKNILNNTINLNDNFRSHYNIINFINQLFANEHNSNTFGNKILFHPTNAKANPQNFYPIPTQQQLFRILQNIGNTTNQIYEDQVQIITIIGKNSSQRELLTINAIAYEILLLLNADKNIASKIAILVNTNEEALKIQRKLKQYGINLTISTNINVFETQTAKDLLTILNSIINLSNPYLFKKAIATNLFNIPYHDLNNFIEKSRTIFNSSNIAEQFFKYKEAFTKSKFLALIYLLINDLNIIYSFYGNNLYNQDITNLIQLGELIDSTCKHMSATHEIIFWLNQKIHNLKDNQLDLDNQNQELIRLDNNNSQIQIMTTHKSKGLEFDIVFCPFFKKSTYSIANLKKNDYEPSSAKFIQLIDENGQFKKQLTNDANAIISDNYDNDLEINRLNYVGLTRARSRLYIYLSNLTTNKDGSYNAKSKSPIFDKLFGFNPLDATDNSHKLFSYPNLFKHPTNAIKAPEILPGVCCYNRNINQATLEQLSIKDLPPETQTPKDNKYPSPAWIKFQPSLSRQSYSSLTKISHNNQNIIEKISEQSNIPINPLEYQYKILNQLKGAQFGIMLHEICENYPLNQERTQQILSNNNTSLEYTNDVISISNKIFNYPIINEQPLCKINNKIAEMEFNLKINNSLSIKQSLHQLFVKYYGISHPYTHECKKLDIINSGFLSGFIDLFFEYQGKYYILDYKTNSLDNYTSCQNTLETDNPLLINTAKNLYHIQYVIYLVAIKRYLEQKLKISDATHLLGGSIYYYIRGLFIKDTAPSGILFDDKCIKLVSEVDNCFK